MKKLITTLAIVSSLALTGVAGAQSIVPNDTTGTNAGITATATGTTAATGTGSQTGSSSVGVPNTGLGGDAAMNYAILGVSSLVAVLAGAYAMRSHKAL